MKSIILSSFLLILLACTYERQDSASPEDIKSLEGTFLYDLNFLKEHQKDLVVLKNATGQAQVVISPQYQGRVMTSTANGTEGKSYGWLNYDLIASEKTQPHINAVGGEDRFWLGPEGGQFSVFFPPDAPFTFENWQTPPVIDTEPFTLLTQDERQAVFQKNTTLTNYSGTKFTFRIDRTIRLLPADTLTSLLSVMPDTAVQWVGFASENAITNTGDQAWQKDTGLLSIWILGMFRHSPATTIVIPYREEAGNTAVVNDEYFGKVPPERLSVSNRHIFFKGDGRFRSKIGVPPQRATPVMGSYAAESGLLTIVSFTLPEGKTDYVNSEWKTQQKPYRGDAINAYNDGPVDGGDPLGPFYELESSSPAAALAPGKTQRHVHRTFHFTGPPASLDKVARQVLAVSLEEIEAALGTVEE